MVGYSHENALAETVNGLYKNEVIHRRGPRRDVDAVELATLGRVKPVKHQRLHSSLRDIPPAEFEQHHYRQLISTNELVETK